MSEDGEAKSVVQIDEMRLNKECVRLPNDYLMFAHRAAEARRDVMECKAALEVVEAELGRAIRATPAKFGLEKSTEKEIASTILLQPEYAKALKSLHRAQYNADMSTAVVNALECKKRTLSLLVDLLGMSYFSAPKVSQKGKEAVEELTKRRVRRPWPNDD